MPLSGRERADALLRWADQLAEGVGPTHQLFSAAGTPSITAATYVGAPWPGWTLGVTYGASLLWPSGVEFVTVVEGSSPMWTWAIADFADRHRADGRGPGAGDTINWGGPIAGESSMDALVIVEPRSLDLGSRAVHLGDDDHVHLLQVVPLHAVELEQVRAVGADRFLDGLGDAAFDPRRVPRIG